MLEEGGSSMYPMQWKQHTHGLTQKKKKLHLNNTEIQSYYCRINKQEV